MTIARLREREVLNRITISDGEIDNYLADFGQGNRTTLLSVGHIIVRVPEQADQKQLARLRAARREGAGPCQARRELQARGGELLGCARRLGRRHPRTSSG